MGRTLAETIREITRSHLQEGKGLLFGQCVTAVGWIGGTVPQLSEADGIRELSMADVAGAGIAVGAALGGRRPIYVIRYQGFMWYNAAPILNYAAKSMEMWKVPCPLLVRALAMEGAIGPVAGGAHHGMVMRMPGIPVCAPMTPGEWSSAWEHFMAHDDPLYVSEHRRGFPVDYEMDTLVHPEARITVFGISAARLNAREALKRLAAGGLHADLFHLLWLKPFEATSEMVASLRKTGVGLVVDSDFSIAGASRSIAYDLTHASGVPVHAVGLEDRSAGFAPHLDNLTPTPEKLIELIGALVKRPRPAPEVPIA